MEGAILLLWLTVLLASDVVGDLTGDEVVEEENGAIAYPTTANLTDAGWAMTSPSSAVLPDDDRDLPVTPYRAATLLALDAVQKKRMQRATVVVCWGPEERYLFQLFAAGGVTAQILRGLGPTRPEHVLKALSEGYYHAAVIVDVACPAARRFLVMASRLRLFYISNFWVIFEDGRLRGDGTLPPPASSSSTALDFVEYMNVTENRFGAQDREDAAYDEEELFLEIQPPERTQQEEDAGIPSSADLLTPRAREALKGLVVLVDSDVMWVQVQRDAHAADGDLHDPVIGFEVFRSCLARPLQAYVVATAGPSMVRWNWTLTREEEVLVTRRRSDLQGATMRAGTIIAFPHEYTHIEDNRFRQNDLFPKMNYPVTQNLAYSLNFGMVIYKTHNYGWLGETGKFDGLMGKMQSYTYDMLATAVFIRLDRLPITDMAAETFNMRTAVLFRQPSKSSVSNIFLLPFSEGVWHSMAVVSVLAAVVLSFQIQWWKRLREQGAEKDDHDHINIGDCVTFIIGAFCQQGFYCTPKMISARMTIITTFMASLFLFTSFSGSIVAIIQSPSNAIQNVEDLLASNMEMGVQDLRFQHVWFQEAKHDMAEKVFKKKIKTHSRPGYVTTQEGIVKLRRGKYAFQVETNEGYKEILDTFTETEKCDVSEFPLFPSAPMCIVTVEKSPYREIMSQSVRWQRESGLLHRIHRIWESERPGCPFATKGFIPIGLQEFYPVLVVLYNGVLLAIAIFMLERLSSTRTVGFCIQKMRRKAYARSETTFSATRRIKPSLPEGPGVPAIKHS